jgi:hypothetical protein
MSNTNFQSGLMPFVYSDGRKSGFRAIQAGGYTLSIQGSYGHYCTPRKEIHPEEYFTMEMAIWKTGNRGFMHFTKSSVMRSFPRYRELLACSDGPHPTVFGYVPVDIIQELINYLNNR